MSFFLSDSHTKTLFGSSYLSGLKFETGSKSLYKDIYDISGPFLHYIYAYLGPRSFYTYAFLEFLTRLSKLSDELWTFNRDF